MSELVAVVVVLALVPRSVKKPAKDTSPSWASPFQPRTETSCEPLHPTRPHDRRLNTPLWRKRGACLDTQVEDTVVGAVVIGLLLHERVAALLRRALAASICAARPVALLHARPQDGQESRRVLSRERLG